MSKVIHLNLIGPGFSNTGWELAFKNNGYDSYECIDWVKLKLKRGPVKMWKILFRFLRKRKPELLFMQIQSDGILTADVVKELRGLAKYVVLYNIDARWPEEVRWVYDVSKYLSVCALSNQRDVDASDNAILVQSSCDMNLYHAGANGIFKYGTEVVFMANNYEGTIRKFPMSSYRQKLIDQLYKWYPDNFKCFGRRQREPMVDQKEEIKIYQDAKIVISCSNFELEGYTSDRLWRAMACGCFVLVKYFEGIESLVSIKKHVDVWRTPEELKEKIDYYLKNPIERTFYAQEGMKYVRMNHTLSRRVNQIIENL